MARPRKDAVQDSVGTPEPVFSPEPEKAPDIADYIAKMLTKKDVPLVEVSHPDADGAVFQHPLCGIRTVRGSLSCTWSDGSKE